MTGPTELTDLTDEAQRAAWVDRMGALVRDRPVICGIAPLAGFNDWVALLERAGGRRPLLVATGPGAGPTPTAEQADVVMLEAPETASMTEELRAQDALLRALPPEVVAAVEAHDPAGEGLWLVGPFVSPDPVLGREVVGARPTSWSALEDKLVADAVWDAVGAPRAGSRIVPVAPPALAAASSALDAGHGVVWAGDARDGFHGGGDFVRWVADEADAAAATAFFAPRCDRVRVMPFLEGVPCSIHGLVLPDGTAALRPVELAILRSGRTFVYGGRGSTWDPPDEDRAWMRELVRRTGEHLRERVGYRGAFGIDGVLTVDGFRPTELNPRYSGGIASLGRVLDSGLFMLLQWSLLAGRDPGVDAATLEAWALPALDAHRFGRAIVLAPERVAPEPWDVHVAWDGGELRRTDEETGWTVSLGPNACGTFCSLLTPPGALDGLRMADLNVALLRLLDAEAGTSFGPVTAPPDVRAGFRAGSRAG